ncbi:XP_029641795.1uncharacterized protein LOC115216501 [Octopus vulgaris]|uniref:XP_029641795.1uncharacterized protein LOC115216501 n=1 Tax=Octopus vulgaris TaxID=6645 RepID=A0AA36F709_OCTVU|nr:XP_029641795.1uncharacterized protein LOC115216501 [Octopus vulgaris]
MDQSAQEVTSVIPLSSSSVSQRIDEMAADVESQLVSKLLTNGKLKAIHSEQVGKNMGNTVKCGSHSRWFKSEYNETLQQERIQFVDRSDVPDSGEVQLGTLIHYDYPFENLVFEGGGNKGIAYCGSLMVLEELGVLNNTKRLAGASAGAMVAALISVGVSSNELLDYLSQDIGKLMLDHKWGYLSLLPNLLKDYGWNPGKKIDEWFRKVFLEKTGNPNITFWEIYKHYGRELCVVVTNVNHMAVEYCHPKTTPHMPVRLAVRMSMSIPGIFSPPSYSANNGTKKHYVDGGLLCNYPIHSFDGWWLSMAPEDTFLNRLRPLDKLLKFFDKSVRFGTFNEKTVGFLLFSDDEPEIMRTHLEDRLKDNGCGTLPEYPETKLSKKRKENTSKKFQECTKHEEICDAFDKLVKAIAKHNPQHRRTIDMKMLTAALLDPELNYQDHILLFDKVVTSEHDIEYVFDYLDTNQNNEIEYQELVNFLETKGINVQSRFLGYFGRPINDLQSYLSALTETMLTNTKRAFIEDRDKHRTVGINTGYIDTTDFCLEDEDKQFLIKQGWNSTVAFFREYLSTHRGILKKRRHHSICQSAKQFNRS